MSNLEPYSSDDVKRRKIKEDLRSIKSYFEVLALFTNEGIRLAFSAAPGINVDPDLFGNLSAVAMQSGIEAVTALGHINTREVILRGDSGFIIMNAVGRFILLGASRNIDDSDNIIKRFRHYSSKIKLS